MRYCFDLNKCTTQVSQKIFWGVQFNAGMNSKLQQVVDKKVKPLTPPFKLNSHEFFQSFKSAERTLKLVTLVPLFPCLNEVQKKSSKSKKEKAD